VNEEMLLPQGRDWSSIPEAGRTDADSELTRGRFHAGSYGERKRRYGIPPSSYTSRREIMACPKWERIGAWQYIHDQGSPPQNPVESTLLRLRKTTLRNGITLIVALHHKLWWSRCQPHAR